MEVRWPLVGLVLVVLLLVAYWLLARRRPGAVPGGGLPVAHVERLRSLPRFHELAHQQLLWTQVQLVSVSLVLAGAVWLSMRPWHIEVVDEPGRPGDVVLCLDGGPASRATDTAVLAQARRLLDRTGDGRVGLQVFQSSTVEVLPLTDDLGAAAEGLHRARVALPSPDNGAAGATGDGLVECARSFDRPRSLRGRAVVLVTANQPGGSLHTLADAASYARDRGIAVYAVPAGVVGGARADLASAAEITGGALVTGRDVLVRAWDLEQARLDPPPKPERRDAPLLPTGLVLLGMLGLVLAGLRGLFR